MGPWYRLPEFRFVALIAAGLLFMRLITGYDASHRLRRLRSAHFQPVRVVPYARRYGWRCRGTAQRRRGHRHRYGQRDLNTSLILENTTQPSTLTPTFAAPVNLSVGTQPIGVVAQDVNNDGFVDLVTLNRGSGNVSTFLSVPDFALSILSPAIANPVDGIHRLVNSTLTRTDSRLRRNRYSQRDSCRRQRQHRDSIEPRRWVRRLHRPSLPGICWRAVRVTSRRATSTTTGGRTWHMLTSTPTCW